MSIFSLKRVSYDYGDNNLLKDIDLRIENHNNFGLIGNNGCGKTTLFKLIKGDIDPLSGDITTMNKIKIAYLSQDLKISSDKSLYDFVLSSQTEYLTLKKSLTIAEQKLSIDNSEKNLNRLDQLHSKFEAFGGFLLETNVKIVLTALDFPSETWTKSVSLFSGGERTRIQLASVLLKPFDLLLLDEPTNHLDIKMIMWLENYLSNLNKPYIIISHDRHFLEQTVTNILEIKNHKLYRYNVGYKEYQKTKNQQDDLLLKQYNKQQEFIKQTEDFIQRNMAGQKVKQAKSRQKMLSKLDVIAKPETETKLKFRINSNERTGNDVFKLENLTIGFPDKILAKHINLNVNYQDRIAILGQNGSGKSTLLKVLNQELKPLSGSVKQGVKLNCGYYDQLHLNLDNSLTVKDTIWQLVTAEPIGYVLSYLARFGFRGDDVSKKVSILSGGEKARLYLAKLIHQKPNLLILDEPTNHLDINMIDSLEAALKEYDGTIIFVSHDRYFIDNVSNKKWSVNNGTIKTTNLGLEEIFTEIPKNKTTNKIKLKQNKPKKVNPIVLEKKLAEIERNQEIMKAVQKDIDHVHLEMAEPATYGKPEIIKGLNKRLSDLEKNLEIIAENIDNLEMDYLLTLEG